MALYKYIIKFRKSPKSEIMVWERYSSNMKKAKNDAVKTLNKEYNNPIFLSIKRKSKYR